MLPLPAPIANSLGLSFAEREDQVAQDVLANFSRAKYEEDLYDWTVGAFNILRGTRAGVQLLICDFKWSASRRKSTGHFSTTLTHWRSSSMDLPPLLGVKPPKHRDMGSSSGLCS